MSINIKYKIIKPKFEYYHTIFTWTSFEVGMKPKVVAIEAQSIKNLDTGERMFLN